MRTQVAQVRGVLAERVVVSVPLDPLLSLKALSGYSSLSVRTLQHIINELPPEQALPCYRLPGKVLVRRSVFDAWLEQFRSQGRPSLVKALRSSAWRTRPVYTSIRMGLSSVCPRSSEEEDGMARVKRPPARPETAKTTINLPKALKLEAKLYAVRTGQDLQDVIAEGLRLVLARKRGR